MFGQIKKKAGIKTRTFHDLRRRAITNWFYVRVSRGHRTTEKQHEALAIESVVHEISVFERKNDNERISWGETAECA